MAGLGDFISWLFSRETAKRIDKSGSERDAYQRIEEEDSGETSGMKRRVKSAKELAAEDMALETRRGFEKKYGKGNRPGGIE